MGDLWLPAKSLRYCVCCETRPGETSTTFMRGGDVQGKHIPSAVITAILCPRCRVGDDYGNGNIPQRRHSAGICFQCGWEGRPVWTCQLRDHVKRLHPGLLEKLINDPFDDIADVPQPEYLGKVGWEIRDEEHPKVIF